jgi:mycofactocin system glycosyltransferase
MRMTCTPANILPPPTVVELAEYRRQSVPPVEARGREPARYKLQPGLDLIPDDGEGQGGGLLFSLRPLMAMRLNAKAFALVSGLEAESTAADAAARVPGLSPANAAAFLDSLAQRRLLARKAPAAGKWPLVSIIVAARGRHMATRACIESLLALDYPGEQCEIIVVDDASEPPLAQALAGLPVRLLRQEDNIGQSAARNLAAAEARGELLAFIDNDCVADPAWLRTLVPYFEEPAVGIVGGRVIAPPPAGRVAAFEAVRSPLDMGAVGGPVGPDEVVAYLPTCNLMVRRDLLLVQEGFASDMRLGEDVDFIWRALRTGVRVWYAPAGQIVHYHRVRLGALLQRRADYGSSEADLQRRHPASRRIMLLPKVGMLMLAMLAALTVSWPVSIAFAALVLAMIAFELLAKFHRLRRLGVAIPASRIGAAVLREHGASLYHLSANVTRYYGLPLLIAGVLWPPLLPAAAVLLLASPISDYHRLRPSLSLPAFIHLYWLEMAAYQLGVWRGCLRRRTLHPLLPILRWRR